MPLEPMVYGRNNDRGFAKRGAELMKPERRTRGARAADKALRIVPATERTEIAVCDYSADSVATDNPSENRYRRKLGS